MDKSGQGVTYPQIIDRPEFKSPLRHLAEGSITAILWTIWLYFILPILTALLWILGIRFLYETLFVGEGLDKLFDILKKGGLGVLVILTAQLSWIYYNHHLIFKRIRGRRKAARTASRQAMARLFDIDPDLLEVAQKRQRIRVVFQEGKLSIEK